MLSLCFRPWLPALLVGLGALACPGRLRADPLQLVYDARGSGEIVTINYIGQDMRGFAGQMVMHLDNGPGFTDPGAQFFGFCVDLDHNVHVGMQYLVNERSTADGLSNGAAIAYLFDKYGQANLDPVQAAGLQIAIWDEAVDGGDGLDTGAFRYFGADDIAQAALAFLSEAQGQAGQAVWLDAAASGPGPDRGQSVLMPGPPSGPPAPPPDAVPEPATLWLVAVAVAGFGAYRRLKGSPNPHRPGQGCV